MKFSFCIFFIGLITFISCGKNYSNNGSPPAPQQASDTLRGREFEFKDRTWREIVSWGTNVIVDIDRPDLFFDPYRILKVTMRFDTSSIWLDVFPETGSYLSGNNYYYSFGSDFFYAVAGHLYIYPVPANHSLIGTKVSVKVKFL
jgi:hypothetical protein